MCLRGRGITTRCGAAAASLRVGTGLANQDVKTQLSRPLQTFSRGRAKRQSTAWVGDSPNHGQAPLLSFVPQNQGDEEPALGTSIVPRRAPRAEPAAVHNQRQTADGTEQSGLVKHLIRNTCRHQEHHNLSASYHKIIIVILRKSRCLGR